MTHSELDTQVSNFESKLNDKVEHLITKVLDVKNQGTKK